LAAGGAGGRGFVTIVLCSKELTKYLDQ